MKKIAIDYSKRFPNSINIFYLKQLPFCLRIRNYFPILKFKKNVSTFFLSFQLYKIFIYMFCLVNFLNHYLNINYLNIQNKLSKDII